MPGKKSNDDTESHLPELVDRRLPKSLAHRLRQHILLATVRGEVSPSELAKALGEGLSQVSYHVKVLRDECEMIVETRTEPRRGAIEHYYRATPKSLLPAKTWRRVKKGLRAVVGAGMANDLFNDLARALKAGKLQGDADYITRTPLVLDEQGREKLRAIAERAAGEADAVQRAAAARMAKGNGAGSEAIACIFALLAFEADWDPADIETIAAESEARRAAS